MGVEWLECLATRTGSRIPVFVGVGAGESTKALSA